MIIPVYVTSVLLKDGSGKATGRIGISTDITERKRAQETLVTRARQQATIAELGQYALAESDLLVLMNKATEVVARTLEVEYCKVLELLADGNALLLRAGVGWKQNMVGNATVSLGSDSQAGYTLMTNGPVIVEDFRSETRFHGPALLLDHGVISGMSVIIRGGEQPFGVLGAHTTRRRQFTHDDVNFIQAVSNILAEAIRRKGAEEKYRDLTESLEELVYRAHPDTFERSYVNKAVENMYGYTAEEWLGDRSLWEKTIHPDDRERVLNIFKTAAQKTQGGAVEYRIIRKDDAIQLDKE
jgi:PAS domain S-box-containing protein